MLAAMAIIDELIESHEAHSEGLTDEDLAHSGRHLFRTFCISWALLLLGFRMLRLGMMSANMGPLIVMLNSMLRDVSQWIFVQFFLLIGYTSAMFAIAGSPAVSATGFFPDACGILQIADWESKLGAPLEPDAPLLRPTPARRPTSAGLAFCPQARRACGATPSYWWASTF